MGEDSDSPSYVHFMVPRSEKYHLPEISVQFNTLAISDLPVLPALNETFALPPLFFAVMVNVDSPFSSVSWLSGETVMRFLPAALIFVLTVSP